MEYKELILTPVSDENKCGHNLEDMADFQHFFFAAQGTPERYDGQNTLPAEPPDWRAIKKQALTFLQQTKDLKLISTLAQAVLNTEGFVPFSECLIGLAELVNEQWEQVYPPLDEEDGDPLERIAGLSHLNEVFIYQTLKHLPLASLRGVGAVSLLSLAGSDGTAASLSDSQIKGIFQENNIDDLQLLFNAVRYSHSSLVRMNNTFIEKAGHEYALDFSKTLMALEQITQVLNEHVALEERVSERSSETHNAEENEDISPTVPTAQALNTTQTDLQEVHQAVDEKNVASVKSREDVEHCLRAITEYYAINEPTSPLPILIHRALKLVNKDFLGVMKDIYPDALPALHQLGGIDENAAEPSDESDDEDGW
jgi:type VI secretion system protein ImpA